MTPLAGIVFPSPVNDATLTANDRAALAAHRGRIADMTLELRHTPLSQQEDPLQGRLDAYTPFLTLPNEIVAEIFIHFLPVYPRRPPIIGRFSPIFLGHICRKWTDIAFSTPELWRAVELSLHKRTRDNETLHLLEKYLKCSASCLLSIKLVSYDLLGELTPFVEAIIPHSARWECLDLCIPRYYLRSFKGPLPFLRSLRIETLAIEDEPATAFRTTPLLYSVALSGYTKGYAPIFPWSQLTVLMLDPILPHACVKILDCAVNLVHCKLRIFHPSTQPESLIVVHTCLESLILSRDTRCQWPFLDILTLPSLRRLQVTETILGRDPVATLVSLVSRSKCNLQQLCILSLRRPRDLYRKALSSVGSLVFDGELKIPIFEEWDDEEEPEWEGGEAADVDENSQDNEEQSSSSDSNSSGWYASSSDE
ncbi:hypothetical protein C8R44DRAFT_883172 [Mycena epipterygia]|nr:hypothetical protein C8R44DRAFT_883172 [Mycena epipterygia]